ncbi:MAG: hypothetical protein ACPLRX_06290 [Candidatus Saccharicenans sp.]
MHGKEGQDRHVSLTDLPSAEPLMVSSADRPWPIIYLAFNEVTGLKLNQIMNQQG